MQVKIHKEIYGQGRPVVLIHGWAMHSGIWRKFAQQLASHYKVICLDLPGHGLSEAVRPYLLEPVVDSLIEQIDEPEFSLLGWSLGGTVAMAMASRYPHRVEKLIVLAGNPRFVQQNDWPGMRAKLLEDFADTLAADCSATLLRFLALQVNGLPEGKTMLKDLRQAIYECESPAEDVLHSGLEILKHSDLRDELEAINCRISIIQGDKDTLVPAQVALSMKQLLPDCQLNIIDGAGHVPFLSHPAEMIEILKLSL